MKYNSFSDFMLNASEKEKKRIFKKAAKRANKDQRKIIKLNK